MEEEAASPVPPVADAHQAQAHPVLVTPDRGGAVVDLVPEEPRNELVRLTAGQPTRYAAHQLKQSFRDWLRANDVEVRGKYEDLSDEEKGLFAEHALARAEAICDFLVSKTRIYNLEPANATWQCFICQLTRQEFAEAYGDVPSHVTPVCAFVETPHFAHLYCLLHGLLADDPQRGAKRCATVCTQEGVTGSGDEVVRKRR